MTIGARSGVKNYGRWYKIAAQTMPVKVVYTSPRVSASRNAATRPTAISLGGTMVSWETAFIDDAVRIDFPLHHAVEAGGVDHVPMPG